MTGLACSRRAWSSRASGSPTPGAASDDSTAIAPVSLRENTAPHGARVTITLPLRTTQEDAACD